MLSVHAPFSPTMVAVIYKNPTVDTFVQTTCDYIPALACDK